MQAASLKELRIEFNALWRVAAAKLQRYCRQRTRDAMLAEDIVQESFARIWTTMCERHGSIQPNAIAFLYRIAQRLIIDYASRNPCRKDVSWEEIWRSSARHPILYDDPSIEMVAEKNDERALTLLSTLSQEQRTLLIWYGLDELSIEEIAARIGKTPGAVRVAIHRAHHTMRKELTFSSENT